MAEKDSLKPPKTEQAFKQMLAEGGIDPFDVFDPDTPEERSPMYTAVELGSHDLVHRLLKSGGNPDGLDGDPDAPRPLYKAVSEGHYAIAERLLAAGASPNSPVGTHGSMRHALHAAVYRNDGNLAHLLLAYGADPEGGWGKGDRLDGTPLFVAAVADSEDVVDPLIEGGAATATSEKGIRDTLGTAMGVACWFKSPNVVRRLLERGEDPNGGPHLMDAATISTEGCFRPPEDTLGCVRALLDAGGDPNLTAENGATVLINLAGSMEGGQPVDDDPDRHPSEAELQKLVYTLVDMLVAAGADPDREVTYDSGETETAAALDPDVVGPAITVAKARQSAAVEAGSPLAATSDDPVL